MNYTDASRAMTCAENLTRIVVRGSAAVPVWCAVTRAGKSAEEGERGGAVPGECVALRVSQEQGLGHASMHAPALFLRRRGAEMGFVGIEQPQQQDPVRKLSREPANPGAQEHLGCQGGGEGNQSRGCRARCRRQRRHN